MFLYLRCLTLTEHIILCVDSSCLSLLGKRSVAQAAVTVESSPSYIHCPLWLLKETTVLLAASPWFLKFLPLAWLSRFSFIFFFSGCWLWASLGLLCLFCPHLWISRFLEKFYSLFLLSLFFSSFHMSPHFLRGVLCSLNDVNLSSYWACLFPISWVLCCLILVV